jgi:oxygen-dependent protoporphyrinogen oxidase
MYDCIIIGGGISGAVSAYYLNKVGLKVLIIEAKSSLGGVISSEHRDGFLIEHGANSTIPSATFNELVKELGLEQSLLSANESAKNRFVAKALTSKDTTNSLALVKVPRSPLQFLSSNLLPLHSKLRLLMEPFIKSSLSEDESVESFFTRRLGHYITQNIIAAIYSGVYAGDIAKLSMRSSLPLLWELEKQYGSLLFGAIKKKLQNKQSNKRHKHTIVSFNHGMMELLNSLEKHLSDTISLNTKVTSISSLGESVEVFATNKSGDNIRLVSKQIVVASPADVTAQLLKEISPKISGLLQQITYSPLGVTHFAIDDEIDTRKISGFGFLIPPHYKNPVLGTVFSSSIFKNRAPKNKALITCYSGSTTNPDFAHVTEKSVILKLQKELTKLLKLKSTPRLINSTFLTNAIPNYELNHYQLIEAVNELSKENSNVWLTGNWLNGVSVAKRVEKGVELAESIISLANENLSPSSQSYQANK